MSKWVPFLLQREWRGEMELCTVAAGRNRSFFVDANGALLACGAETEPGLLGLPGGISHPPVRWQCRRPCRPWREFAPGLWSAAAIPTSP
jgi:hypothetical protein